MNSDFVLTVCPFCGCGCQLYLQVMDGQVTGVVPCKTDEMSEGKPCIKGRNAADFINHPDRLKSPLIKQSGKFEPISWEEALDIVAKRLIVTKEKYGPDSIGILSSAKCTNEENFVVMKFARTVIGTNNIDHCARLCHAPTVVGLAKAFGSGAMTNSVPEIEHADCIFVIGSNTTEQHPLVSLRVMRAKEKGAKLIVADPRRTPLVDFADIYLPHKPGTDAALLNGLMHIITREGLEDRDFIRERTEGFEALEKKLKEYPPEKVCQITGVSKALLEKAAKAYGRAERGSILYGMGITQHTTGTENVLCIANLAMLTGNVGREFTGVNPLRGQNNVQGACDMGALPNVFSGYQPVVDSKARDKFEKAWGTKLSPTPGLRATEMTEAAIDRAVRAMYIVGENPALSDADINHVKKSLSSLDFLVVQDIFLSEVAEFAHVVLPACSFAEKEGTFTATDRRVQRVRKAMEPVGDSKPDWVIVSELAKRMGATDFSYASSREIMEEIVSLTPIYAGISYERLDKGEIVSWPCPSKDHPGTRFLHKDAFTRGKGQFLVVDFKEPAELPDAEYPFILTTGRLMFQFHTGTMTRRIPRLERELPTGYVEINPKDAKKLSISQGDMVKVQSRRGEIRIRALVTEEILPGVVFIPFHFAECAANVLTSRYLDPEAKIAELKVCAVKICKE